MARPVKGSEPRPVSVAVRELRAGLGQTQQEFAVAFGVAIGTVARWETTRPPRGKALEQLMGLAKKHSKIPACAKAALIFKNELYKESDIRNVEELRRVIGMLQASRDETEKGQRVTKQIDRLLNAYMGIQIEGEPK